MERPPITARDIASFLFPDGDEREVYRRITGWPPNLFAFTSSVLLRTGAYRAAVCPPSEARWNDTGKDAWHRRAENIGAEWLKKLDELCDSFPLHSPEKEYESLAKVADGVGIGDLWQELQNGFTEREVEGVDALLKPERWELLGHLMLLHAIADEACQGYTSRASSSFNSRLNEMLVRTGSLARIDSGRGRVVPKNRTPGVGVTVRSLSNYLAFYDAPIAIKYSRVATTSGLIFDDSREPDSSGPRRKRAPVSKVRALVVPWPLHLLPKAFRRVPYTRSLLPRAKNRFFVYDPGDDSEALLAFLESAIDQANSTYGTHRMLVLPEQAVYAEAVPDLERLLAHKGLEFYISGTRSAVLTSNKSIEPVDNSVEVKWLLSGTWQGESQRKHHRWMIDGHQVAKYQLPLEKKYRWWECTKLDSPSLSVTEFSPGISICSLICEDLARQDPVLDVIRSVGPSLVVALLMDGPQKIERWSARYASILVEDPGSCVLSVTSLGMVALWHNVAQSDGQYTIGLWSQPHQSPRELALSHGQNAASLELVVEGFKEATADGRTAERPRLRLENWYPLAIR